MAESMFGRMRTISILCTVCVWLVISTTCNGHFKTDSKFYKVAAWSNNSTSDPVPDDCLHCICFALAPKCTMPNPVCRMDWASLSCGPYQIKEDYWTDATLKGGDLDGDWKKCSSSFDCSERAVQGYMSRYALSSRLGHAPTCEDFARIHNGGPNGYKKQSTLKYWAKVQACLHS